MNELLIELMRLGPHAWNAYRAETGHAPVSLATVCFDTIDGDDEWDFTLRGYDLSWCDLTAANLSGGLLADCDLSHARLAKTVFSHTTLRRCNLSHATLLHAHVAFCRVLHCNLTDATIGGLVITASRFDELCGFGTVTVPYRSTVDVATVAESAGHLEDLDRLCRV